MVEKQLIVSKGVHTFADVLELAMYIATNHTHGVRDNDIAQNNKIVVDKSQLRIERLFQQDLICSCRNIAKTTIGLFGDKGVYARSVDLISALPFGEYYGNNRHTVTEIQWGGKYVHIDTDLGVMFGKDEYLSTLELQKSLHNHEEVEVVRLVQEKKFDMNVYPLLPELLRTDAALLRWYAPVLNAMNVGVGLHTLGDSKENIEALTQNIVPFKKNQLKLLSTEVFTKRYYIPDAYVELME